MLLQGKVALVTGGGSGIGRATAEALAQAGARVVIGNRTVEQGEAAVRAIQTAGGQAIFQRTDVTQPAQVAALVRRAVHEFGRLDVAFNNAGALGSKAALAEQDLEEMAFLFDVNVKGVFYCMKYEIEQMLRTGGGAIVNNSSISGLRGFAGLSLYGAAKHAVVGLTRAAALDYAKKGIRVNAVAPGPIETPLLEKSTGGNPHRYDVRVPIGRIGQPAEVAAAVVWLCSDAAAFVTGHTLPLDGGMTA
jgi:NAD(P)-dependent dehydrogenase (short-subunit alcohol dehydrogenase family)